MKLKVLEIKEELNNCFSLILEKPVGFQFYPGQFLDIELDIQDYDKRGKVRAFTISSSSSEDFLMITPKKGISDFKKAMEKLKPGDFIDSSYPAGTFTLDETSPAVFIAGGIGITPFRSMFKYIQENNLSAPITLLYSNPSDDFLFKKELDSLQKQNKNIKINYINTKKAGRISKTELEPIVKLHKNPVFYIAGPESMIFDMSKILTELGTDETNIRIDSFDGYE